jgi:hypothetical protein
MTCDVRVALGTDSSIVAATGGSNGNFADTGVVITDERLGLTCEWRQQQDLNVMLKD